MDVKYFYCALCEYKTKRKYDLERHHNAKHTLNAYKYKNKDKHINIEEKHINNNDNYIDNDEKSINKTENHIDIEKNHLQTKKNFLIVINVLKNIEPKNIYFFMKKNATV